MMYNFRRIQKGEEASAAILEKESLRTAWSEKQISEIPENCVYLVCENGGEICGIASIYLVFGEGEIMNIAVSQKHRRKGLAFGLMSALEKEALDKNCENIILEVAVDNLSAISLYKKCGYAPVGTRKGFYKGVDAIIMEKKL